MNSQVSKLPGLELSVSRQVSLGGVSSASFPSPTMSNYTPTSTNYSMSNTAPQCHPSKEHIKDAPRRSTSQSLDSSDPSSRPLPPHACPEPGCPRRFNRKYTLAEHMKTHTGERPHVCPVRTCAKRFSTSGNLSRHKRLHGYIEPLKCPVEGCVCAFPSNNKLEKHMQFHYGSAVKVCPVVGCGKTFSTTGNLNRHLKHQHTGLERRLKPVVMMAPPIVMGNHRSPTSSESWAPPSGSSQFRAQPLALSLPLPPPPPPLVYPPPAQQQQSMWAQEQQLPPMAAPLYSPTKACVEMFEEVWNPEMLDTLVSVLHDPNARYQAQQY